MLPLFLSIHKNVITTTASRNQNEHLTITVVIYFLTYLKSQYNNYFLIISKSVKYGSGADLKPPS